MIDIDTTETWLINGDWVASGPCPNNEGRKGTIAYSILQKHDRSSSTDSLAITFDTLTSHDITFVGIIQTAIASGLEQFPVPYVLTNCHNSLCAVGGTINEDDHSFGLSAARKFGGDYVPAHLAVIHQYIREMHAGCGKMILGSDSHTRYGALGTLAMGEGGPELVKQLLGRTYDIENPEVIAIWLEGAPRLGVGPQDIALAIIRELFPTGFVKNKIMEFMGPGMANLSVDYRIGIDVMTTETTCLSSIWQTDKMVEAWLAKHGRGHDYTELAPAEATYYDGKVIVNLSQIEPMIALPFHPSNAVPIKDFLHNPTPLLEAVAKETKKILPNIAEEHHLYNKYKDGGIWADQCIIAGCAGGTHENMVRMAQIVKGKTAGKHGVEVSAYPASQPVYFDLIQSGHAASLMEAGVTLKTAFCGPCFGAGDVPANGELSLRHTTRNFPNREGSKPTDGQISYVALMDTRSIAATAINGGRLTPATELPSLPEETPAPYQFKEDIYTKRVFKSIGMPEKATPLVTGPGIASWPTMPALSENLILFVACVITDPVTTTDELIPSGETSSYRSNPHKLAEFTLSRKDPEYVGRAKKVYQLENERRMALTNNSAVSSTVDKLLSLTKMAKENTSFGSLITSIKPGDGSAREQAASCQKVLGGLANIAKEYATKRYRSNLINWGLLPFIVSENIMFEVNDIICLTGVRTALLNEKIEFTAQLFRNNMLEKTFTLFLPDITKNEREILLAGCLINYYANDKKE